ncbi:MAG: nucleotidyltransferase family protein [Burkholderiales bacterium]|nr:nucleotidyltransferase family protein [Burkholderiales bacterium]
MRAMILAAGRGERMRPLTDRVPKAMLPAGGRPLIVHLIERLARAGFRDLVINVSHLAGAIEHGLADGAGYGVRIAYSRERDALETAGGIAQALPLLGAAPFVVANCDVYTDFDFARLAAAAEPVARGRFAAHLVLVPNPPHHPAGDFGLAEGRLDAGSAGRHTYSGIGVYAPRFFSGIAPGERLALARLLQPAIARGEVSGELHRGVWIDAGSPERLAALERALGRS